MALPLAQMGSVLFSIMMIAVSKANRFTIAHELGHILLGHVPQKGAYIATFSKGSSPRAAGKRFCILAVGSCLRSGKRWGTLC